MTRTARTWAGIGGVVGAFAVLVALVVLFGGGNFRVHGDQDGFHVPTVRQFERQWPHVDLHDYPVATAPAYHLLMAGVSHYVSGDLRLLRSVGAIFGFALVIVAAWAARDRSPWLALPLVGSFYVLTATVWLLPENAAWLLVMIGLSLALRARGTPLFVGSAVLLAVLMFTRQSHAWLFGVFVLAALFPDDTCRPDLRPKNLAATLAAVLPGLAVLVWLVWMWHGLSPPLFQPGTKTKFGEAVVVSGLAPAAAGMTLAVLGGFGVFLLPWLWPARRGGTAAAIGAVAGLIIGAFPESTYSFVRRSGLWAVVQRYPRAVIHERSLIFIALATLGGAVAAAALARLRPRDRLLLAAALAGLAAAQTMQVSVFQRYYEPFVLIWLILAASAEPTENQPRRRPWQIAVLAALFVIQIAATAYTLRNAN